MKTNNTLSLTEMIDYYKKEIKKNFPHKNLDSDSMKEKIAFCIDCNKDRLYFPNTADYKKNDDYNSIFDTLNERNIFLEIEKQLNRKYRILPEVCFRKIIQSNSISTDLSLYRFADFFICDYYTFEPLLSIEFDEEHHRSNIGSIIKDISKNKILDEAKIKHISIKGTTTDLNENQIQEIANNILNQIYKILK